ncbi:MAG: acetate--CoA ligase family protein [Candidatus Hodarchaeota archaeon]
MGVKIFEIARDEGRKVLSVYESKKVLELEGFPVNKFELASSKEEAIQIAQKLSFPLVAKIVSPQIVHKTDITGVIVGLRDLDEVTEAYDQIIAVAHDKVKDAKIDGILMEEMVKDGTEIIIGSTIDPVFGRIIMFGLGGVFVEVLEDVSFRLVPLTRYDAKEMIAEIKAAKVLDGFRGRPPADKKAIEDLILKTAEFVMKYDKITEFDMNPVFALKKGVTIVDARIVL